MSIERKWMTPDRGCIGGPVGPVARLVSENFQIGRKLQPRKGGRAMLNSDRFISGELVIEPGSCLGDQVREEAWPCSCFVAAWLQAVQGREADDIDGWAKLFPPGWEAINVYPGWQPWDGIRIAYTVAGYDMIIQPTICQGGEDDAPELDDGRWHIIQRWKNCEGPRETWEGGHVFLAYRDGESVTVYHTDAKLGYRVEIGYWKGAAGLEGYSVGIAYLKVPA